MNRLKRLIAILFLLLIIPVSAAYGEDNMKYPMPTASGYVNDYAGILDSSTEQKITSIGRDLDNKTNAQIVVVTLNKLPENTTIEEYANGLFREWGIGDKKLRNGILVLVNIDTNDRAIRTEIGDGLEGRVPDAISNRITDEIILPYFRQGDYNSGLLKGYYALSSRVAEEYNITLSNENIVPVPNSRRTGRSNLSIIIGALILFMFDGFFLRWRILRFILYMMAMSGRRGGRGGFGGSGGGFGGFGGGSSSGGGSTGRW